MCKLRERASCFLRDLLAGLIPSTTKEARTQAPISNCDEGTFVPGVTAGEMLKSLSPQIKY